MGETERRLFRLTWILSAGGSLLAWAVFGWRPAISFAAGAALAGGNLILLRSTVQSIFFGDLKRSRFKILAGSFFRLMLIPLCLYVMIRFLFLDILAAVAGFAVFICSVFVEGVLEAFGSSPK